MALAKNKVVEIEAKFLIRKPEQFDQVLAALSELGYGVSERATETHVDRYFDTSDWSILRAGWTYRSRERRGHQKLTLKSLGSKRGAVFTRDEIEQPLPDRLPPRNGILPPGPVQKRLAEIVNGMRWRELFRVQSRRTVFAVTVPGNEATRLELDLYRTHISATKANPKASGRLDFTELELELETGDAEAVETLANMLRDQVGLVPAQLSKFERGIQAAGLSTTGDEKQQRARRLEEEDPVLDIVYRHFQRQVGALKLHQPRAWEGLDPAGVHQMRVAIRRTRAVLRTFRHMLPMKVEDQLSVELRCLERHLGQARDADVCMDAFVRHEAALDETDTAAIQLYEIHLRKTTADAYTLLVEVLASERYAMLIEYLESFVATGPTGKMKSDFGGLRISDCANEYIHRTLRIILRHGNRISENSTARQLHKLRIKAKRLRYLLDFFSADNSKKWARLITVTRELQDLLGGHQDAIMVRERLMDYANLIRPRNASPDFLIPIGRLMQHEEDRAVDCRRRFPEIWARFRISLG